MAILPDNAGRELTADEKRKVAADMFNVLGWGAKSDGIPCGFITCPGVGMHTTPNGYQDCIVLCDEGVPSLKCVHSSCSAVVAEAAHAFRSRLGRLSFEATGGGRFVPKSTPVSRTERPKATQAEPVSFHPIPIPPPLPDPTIRFLESVFQPGELVAISSLFLREGNRLAPTHGQTYERNALIQSIRAVGSIREMFPDSPGLYVRVNPMIEYGSKDFEVSAYRHVLIDIDKDDDGQGISLERQFGAIIASGLPVSVVTYSGRVSLHALVRVDAANFEEHKNRGAEVLARMRQFLPPDEKCFNAARYSRLPGAQRLVSDPASPIREYSEQQLLAVSVGPASWDEYKNGESRKMFGQRIEVGTLLAFDAENDPDNLIGNRWLCKGGTLLFTAQSGVGKSSLVMQLSVAWSLHDIPAMVELGLGLVPVKPLRIVIIQAENDLGDMAEQFQGVVRKLTDGGAGEEIIDKLKGRLLMYRNDTQTGVEFVQTLEAICRLDKPDLVWVDPLLNYLGEDANDQAKASSFCHELSKIAHSTGVVIALVHHNGKPKNTENMPAGSVSDEAYAGFGSSIFTNWAREVLSLKNIPSPNDVLKFSLTCTKRRKRAGLVSWEPGEMGKIVARVYLTHSPNPAETGLLWWRQAKPVLPESEDKKKKGAFRR